MPRTVRVPPHPVRLGPRQDPVRLGPGQDLVRPALRQDPDRLRLARVLAPLRHQPRVLHLLPAARLPPPAAPSLELNSPQVPR